MSIDQRVVDFVVVFLLFVVILSLGTIADRILGEADSINSRTGCFAALLFLPILSTTFAILGGTVVYMLWGLIAPVLGWPRIDLLTAIAINWLASVLTRGITTPKVEVTKLPKS